MPDVVGQQLDVALSDVASVGVSEDGVEIVGGGLFGVVDEANWMVCEQLPDPGDVLDGQTRLTVDRTCGDEPTDAAPDPSEAPSEASTDATEPAEEPTEPPEDDPITVESNAEFAALLALTDTCSPAITEFATKYAGRTIAFDGTVVAMNNHEGAKTRHDIMINAGDFVDENTALPGPSFQFRDENLSFDMHWVGAQPDTVGVGLNLHVVAQVDKFLEQQGCLFLIDPVETSVR